MKGRGAWLSLLLLAGLPLHAQPGTVLPTPASSSATPKAADPNIHRLILRDGSYQVVAKYEIEPGGGRVRYISAERGGDWEEVPASLIDWKATEDYAKQHAGEAGLASDRTLDKGLQEAAEIDAEEKADRSRNLEVLPNLRLPEETGIWVLDYFHDMPELVELQQNSGEINERTGHNLLKAALNASGATRQPLTLNGRHAKPGLHESQPAFYVSLDEDQDEEPSVEAITVDTHGAGAASKPKERSSAASEYVIVSATVKKDYRLVPPVRITASGTAAPAEDVTLTRAEVLPGKRWLKLIPRDPLPAGDYVLMEVLSPREVNLSVWDFRIDPNADDNPNAILPLQRYQISH